MKQIDKIIKSQSEPKDLNVLWLDTSNPEEPILKEYDGGWKVVAGGGGGGDATDAIKYTEQTLTSPQQMQARKNQGLYYEEEGIVQKRVNFDELGEPETTLFSTYYSYAGGIIRHQCKFTDDVLTLENLISYGDVYDGQDHPRDISELRTFTVLETENITIKCIAPVYGNEGEEIVQTPVFYTVEGEFHSSGEDYLTIDDPYYGERPLYAAEQGTYAEAERGIHGEGFYGWMIGFIVYEADGMVPHCIEPKYIKDMYYEAEGIGAKTVFQNDNTIGEGFQVDGVMYLRRSEDVITTDKLISVNIGTYGAAGTEYLASNYDVSMSQLTGLPIWECAWYGATAQKEKFYIVTEDTTYDNTTVVAGVYLPSEITVASPYVYSVTFKGNTMITHPVPSKYLPITKTLDYNSTDEQIPSAKTVYNIVGDVETLLSAL